MSGGPIARCWLCGVSQLERWGAYQPKAGLDGEGAHECWSCTKSITGVDPRPPAVRADDECRENVYTCQRCGAVLVTVDRDEGATPMFMTCGRYNPHGCGGMMHSAMYPKGPRPAHIPAPTHEWYAPDDRERKRLRRTEPALYDHVAQGGLLIRPIVTGGAHA